MQQILRSTSYATLSAAAAASMAVGSAVLWSREATHAQELGNNSKPTYKIEADLMDKIASKSYIQQRNPHPDKRPRGVPKTMRIIAIDLPEMRESFDGECRVDLKRVFPDGSALAKALHQNESTTEVMQKCLAQSVVQCRNAKSKRLGVEIMEASVAKLNPHNMRKTHRFGRYLYDPGKFARPQESEEHFSPASPDEEIETDDDNNKKQIDMVLATQDDELDAPWNQYAWIEELQSRVFGFVYFGAPMEKSSGFTRVMFGNAYKQTVPSLRKTYEWFFPRFFQRDPCGVDGQDQRNNWASQKPHAVIAHGAALQRVPGSMKLLTDCCREARVPLYIVFDPRGWGGNTHKDMAEALRDMRRTVKGRIVAGVLEEQGGAFSRGRVVGQLQNEAKWQAKEMHRKTQQAIREKNDEFLRGRESDWSRLNAEELKSRLAEHGVILSLDEENAEANDLVYRKKQWSLFGFWRRHANHDLDNGKMIVSPGMMELCLDILRSRERTEANKDDMEEDHDGETVEVDAEQPVSP